MFWSSYVTKLIHFGSAIDEVSHLTLSPTAPISWAIIAISLIGSMLVIVGGRYAVVGAAMLAGFTLLTIPMAHDFWHMTGE
jgi:transmembrane protein